MGLLCFAYLCEEEEVPPAYVAPVLDPHVTYQVWVLGKDLITLGLGFLLCELGPYNLCLP